MRLCDYLRDVERSRDINREVVALRRAIMVAEQGDRDGVDEEWVQRLTDVRNHLEQDLQDLSFRIAEVDHDQPLLTKDESMALMRKQQ
jgi:hypothetical protein